MNNIQEWSDQQLNIGDAHMYWTKLIVKQINVNYGGLISLRFIFRFYYIDYNLHFILGLLW